MPMSRGSEVRVVDLLAVGLPAFPYYRLFELYNLAIWPAQLLALALGVLILALLRPGPVWKGRVGQGADLLETRVWDALSDRVASYSASRSFRTAAI